MGMGRGGAGAGRCAAGACCSSRRGRGRAAVPSPGPGPETGLTPRPGEFAFRRDGFSGACPVRGERGHSRRPPRRPGLEQPLGAIRALVPKRPQGSPR